MGPGIVGTNTRLGFSGMEVGPVLDAAAALGGDPIACLRVSFADARRATRRVAPQRDPLRLARASRVRSRSPSSRGGEGGPHPRRTRRRRLADRHELVEVDAARRVELLAAPGSARRVDGPPGGGRPGAVPGRGRRRRARRPRPPDGSVADRLERLVNLTATLLETRRPLTLDELAERVGPATRTT